MFINLQFPVVHCMHEFISVHWAIRIATADSQFGTDVSKHAEIHVGE